MTDLSPQTFAFWTAIKSRDPMPGEPEVVVDGWKRPYPFPDPSDHVNRWHIVRSFRFDHTLTTTEQAAALWFAERWARWRLDAAMGYYPCCSDLEACVAGDVEQFTTDPARLLNAALAVADELAKGDGDGPDWVRAAVDRVKGDSDG